jgi:hypothetical protein
MGEAMTVAACSLGADDGRTRMLRWRALAEAAGPAARRIGPVLEISYPLDVRQELESLVAAERQCCQFVGWDIMRRGDTLVLQIAADPGRPDDIDSFAELFGASSGGG